MGAGNGDEAGPASGGVTEPAAEPIVADTRYAHFLPGMTVDMITVHYTTPMSRVDLPGVTPGPEVVTDPPDILPVPFYVRYEATYTSVPSTGPAATTAEAETVGPLALGAVVEVEDDTAPTTVVVGNVIFVSC